MKKILFLLHVGLMSMGLMSLCSCDTVNRMNCLVNQSTYAIYENAQAVQTSTAVVQQNRQIIEESTRALQANHRLLEEASK